MSPPSHRRISTIHYRIFHTGTPTEEIQLRTGLSLNKYKPLYKRRALSQAKGKEKYNIVITKITNNLLVISKDHK